jgi:hypothetical protein
MCIKCTVLTYYLPSDQNYVEYLDVLTEGLNRVLLVRGSGNEVRLLRFFLFAVVISCSLLYFFFGCPERAVLAP